jgi:hypothetical protein
VTRNEAAPYRKGMSSRRRAQAVPRWCRLGPMAVAALASVTVPLVALVGTAAAASPPSKAARAVLRDYADNNHFDEPHSCGAVQDAIASLSAPTDAPQPGAVAALRRYERSVCPAGRFVRIVGGSARQRDLARVVALRTADPTIVSVRFRSPAAFLKRQGVRAAEMVVTSSEPRTLRGMWQAQLYAGTFLALASRHRVPLGAISAAGSEAPIGRWPRFDIYGRQTKSIEIAVLSQRFLQLAAASGAKVSEFRTAATPARAIAVTLRVDDPAAFLKHHTLRLLNVLNRTTVPLLGYYVGLEDARGHLVWATSRLPNEGGVFAIPRLDACSPVKHSEAFGVRQRPCPAK